MDFSARLIARAWEQFPNLTWVEGDALQAWPFPAASFDKIYSFSFLQYIPNSHLEHLTNECKRVLRSGGTIFHQDVPDKTKFSNYFNTPKRMLRRAMSSYFSNRMFSDGSYWHKESNIAYCSKTWITSNGEGFLGRLPVTLHTNVSLITSTCPRSRQMLHVSCKPLNRERVWAQPQTKDKWRFLG